MKWLYVDIFIFVQICTFLSLTKTTVQSVPVHYDKVPHLTVSTKYGKMNSIIDWNHNVEKFFGIPYATPPLAGLRYMPPVTPTKYGNVTFKNEMPPVCPQKLPNISNMSDALLTYPRDRIEYLKRLSNLLSNQNEDCLYLNLYVPFNTIEEAKLRNANMASVVFVHGESYSWNSGNPYDATILASRGQVIVATINYRLGALGFLKTGLKTSPQGNYGVMDIIASLNFLKENIPHYGGDPKRITLMGHGTGSALVNFVAVSVISKDLVTRVILLSGSGSSLWALQTDPIGLKRKVAEQSGCHGNLLEDDMSECLRSKSLSEIMKMDIESSAFLPSFAPFVDGTALSVKVQEALRRTDLLTLMKNGPGYGYQLANFPDKELIVGVTSTESYLDFSTQDIEFGLDKKKLDRMLRDFVKSNYKHHLPEIYAVLRNEYTSWNKSVRTNFNHRDTIMDILSDGQTAAEVIRTAMLHTAYDKQNTYMIHFNRPQGGRKFPFKGGSVRGDDLPYIFGYPIAPEYTKIYTKEYDKTDVEVSQILIHYITNFIKAGNPNGKSSKYDLIVPHWDAYEKKNQYYLNIKNTDEKYLVTEDHYRSHKLSMWLNLIPKLHVPPSPSPNAGAENKYSQSYSENSKPEESPPTTKATTPTVIPETKSPECVTTTPAPVEVVKQLPKKDSPRSDNNFIKKQTNSATTNTISYFLIGILAIFFATQY